MTDATTLLGDLRWRGLIHQTTDEAALVRHLGEAPRKVYAGFDPTADSLTIGNLVPILLLRRFQEAGHTPVVVMGGGTGLIGDPSGKETERQLQALKMVQTNVASQRRIFEGLLSFEGDSAATIVNNHDWLGELKFVDALRDIGKHFSVNMMIQKESVRERLHAREQGISYTEFSYMILQAYDFLRLYEDHGVSIQVGGSDQWGNIVAGADLIRRLHATGERDAHYAHALTTPLVEKADGGKFGKTESGAIWLTAERTSPYAFYQFWLNSDDADVAGFLKTFTLFTKREIEELEGEHSESPGARVAHRALAAHMTQLLHGRDGLDRAERASKALFSGDVASLDRRDLEDLFASAPSTSHALADLPIDGLPLVDLLPGTSLAASKREAREFLAAGAVSLNGEKALPDARITQKTLLHGAIALLRRGKRSWHVTRWT